MNNKEAYICIIIVIIIGMLVLSAFVCITDKSCEVKRATPNNEEIQQTITEQVNNYYALTAQVVKIDRAQDIVTVEDSVGNLWEFYGVEDWEIGDCASMVMDDMGTDRIYDDEIVNVRYAAWTLTK
jgi:hypothetical protein